MKWTDLDEGDVGTTEYPGCGGSSNGSKRGWAKKILKQVHTEECAGMYISDREVKEAREVLGLPKTNKLLKNGKGSDEVWDDD